VAGIREKYGLSERHACRIVSQPRGTQRYVPTVRADEEALTRAIVILARVRPLRLPPHLPLFCRSQVACGQGPGSAHLAS
jgi:hypothetical protein